MLDIWFWDELFYRLRKLERQAMSAKNTSDSIEEYIKSILAQAGIVELKRSELADVFQVVPSQINYVIKTRFTESRGYIVESESW